MFMIISPTFRDTCQQWWEMVTGSNHRGESKEGTTDALAWDMFMGS